MYNVPLPVACDAKQLLYMCMQQHWNSTMPNSLRRSLGCSDCKKVAFSGTVLSTSLAPTKPSIYIPNPTLSKQHVTKHVHEACLRLSYNHSSDNLS